MATISVHNGTMVSRAHNLRLPGIVEKQPHIDPNGLYEVWYDEAETAAYRRLFQTAVDEYNAKQTRGDRRINNYHAKVMQSEQQSPVYELVVGVYGSDCSPKVGYQILHKYFEEWSVRNPHLMLIGAYYHADEQGDPHIHVDYVPVGTGFATGMKTRASLRRALEQQGFEKSGRETAQIAWERSEREYLESICVAHSLTIEHPGGRHTHYSVDEYEQAREEERQRFIASGDVELHEKRTLGNSRVTVDADGLQILREQSRAYRIMISEPSLRTRSAIAAQRQRDILQQESDLLERERTLEQQKRDLILSQQEFERAQAGNRSSVSALAGLLIDISDILQGIVDNYPLPQLIRKALAQIIQKIDFAIKADTPHIQQESERE